MEEKDIDNEHRLTTVESKVEDHERRLDDVEKRQESLDKLASCVATISNNQVHMDEDIKEIKSDVKDLATIPAKRWNSVVDKIILVIVSSGVTWLLTQLVK